MRPWDTLNDDEKRLFSRMAEVYAGFSEYTDHQVGRIVEYLEESGQLDNTIIFYCADNGASGEGSPNGSVNEGKYFNAYPDTIEDNLPLIDQLGSPATYNHYPTGWAVAFSTPYRMFKRYTYQGGICDPLVVHWPAGIKARGEVREQYHHSTDIYPTILDACGVEMPEVVNGAEQSPLAGVSMRYSFDAADAPTQKETQYYEMFGMRGALAQGLEGRHRARPDQRAEQLRERHAGSSSTPTRTAPRRTTSPPSTRTRSKSSPTLWFAEAKTQQRAAAQRHGGRRQGPREVHRRWSSTSRCRRAASTRTTRARPRSPSASAANVHGVSYKALAEVELTGDAQGVIFAHGSRFGGHALFVKDGKLTYAYNFLGIPPETLIGADVPASGRHIVGIEFTKERMGEHHESHRAAQALRRRRGGRRGGDPDDDRALLASAARACASATTAATRSAASTGPGSSSPAARSPRSCSTSRTTSTSTSSAISRRRSRVTDLASWNDTATRAAIEEFVASAPEPRVAVFDNDGTLWCEKPMPIQLDFIVRRWAAMAEADAVAARAPAVQGRRARATCAGWARRWSSTTAATTAT